jgi:hypothetical protein
MRLGSPRLGLRGVGTRACCLRVTWSALWLLMLSFGDLRAQASLSGTVRDSSTNDGIAGVEVLLEGLGRRALTDSRGRYSIGELPAGSHVLLIRMVGYRFVTTRLNIVADKAARRDITLAREAVRLDSIAVTARVPGPRGSGLEALDERRRRGFGRFLDSDELRRSEHLTLITLLRRLGVEVRGRQVVGRNRCPMTLYLDGVRIKDPPQNLLNSFTVFGLAGVEVYASVAQIPQQFDGLDQTCGVLVLWSRRGS